MKTYIKTMEYDFIIDVDKIVSFEKIENSNVYNFVYYNVYTVDGKVYKITEDVFERCIATGNLIID